MLVPGKVGPLCFGAGVLLILGWRPLAAQVSLTLSQTPNVFPTPTIADYDAGFVVNPTGIDFLVDDLTIAGFVFRTTIVSIRSSSATMGGGKAVSDLEWRRSDLATWTPISTVDAVVEQRPVVRFFGFTFNDPWSNAIFLRARLDWANDPPNAYSTDLILTLTVTTP